MTTLDRLDALSGLEGAKRLVRGLATSGSGVHAVLLYGAPGGGATALAEALAQAWMCVQPGPEGACGLCQSCRAFERGKSADLLHLRPSGPSRIFKLGAITGSPPDDENPTALKPFFRTSTLYARHKVAVLHDAERMNGDAANALLKTLEEPFSPTRSSFSRRRASARSCRRSVRGASPSLAPCPRHRASGRATLRRRSTILSSPRAHQDVWRRSCATLRPTATSPTSRSRSPRRRRAEALVITEAVRGIAERLEKAKGCNARAANAETVALLAAWVARDPDADPRWTAILADAHRRILQNGNAGIVLDAAFVKMLR